MANRNYANSRIYTGHVMPVMLDVSIPIGSTGAVGTIAGPYIKAVTRLGVGTYQIQMQDNYSRYYLGFAQLVSPSSGSALRIDATNNDLSVGSNYVITTLGDGSAAQWAALGVPDGVTPAVGVPFVALATGSGASSTSRVKAVGNSGTSRVELCGDPSLESAPFDATNGGPQGAIVLIQCLQAQVPSATTQGTPLQYAAADPTSGSILKVSMLMSNSSVTINGE